MRALIHNLYTGGQFATCVLFFLFSLFLFTGCKKDLSPLESPDENQGECDPILPCNQVTIGGGYTYIIDFENFVVAPMFNPNSESQFVYLKRSNSNLWELITYDLISKERKILYAGIIWYQPQWGKNDWILFCQNDENIYKIKSNGDSLTKLTNSNNLHHPIWNYDGSKFLAFTEASNLFSLLFDVNGNIMDTIYFGQTNNSNFQNPNYIVSNIYQNVSFFNLNTNSLEFHYNYSGFNSTTGGSIFWLNNTAVIYSNINGLNRLSIPDLTNQNFKKSCNSKIYQWGDINSSKTKMIWSRGDYTQIDECTLKYKSRIYFMDIDGNNEQEIDLN
ncbi:MAG: hypothetical protein ACK4K0_07810 [Flavobacteriales bacterium]